MKYLSNDVIMASKINCMIMFYDVIQSHVNQKSRINNQSYMYYATILCCTRKHVNHNLQLMLSVCKNHVHYQHYQLHIKQQMLLGVNHSMFPYNQQSSYASNHQIIMLVCQSTYRDNYRVVKDMFKGLLQGVIRSDIGLLHQIRGQQTSLQVGQFSWEPRGDVRQVKGIVLGGKRMSTNELFQIWK